LETTCEVFEQQLEELAPRGRGSAMVEPGVESSECSSRCHAEGGDLVPEFGDRGAHARPTAASTPLRCALWPIKRHPKVAHLILQIGD
jgi:hypothetical protein